MIGEVQLKYIDPESAAVENEPKRNLSDSAVDEMQKPVVLGGCKDQTRGRRRHGRHDGDRATESSGGRAVDLVNTGADKRVPDVDTKSRSLVVRTLVIRTLVIRTLVVRTLAIRSLVVSTFFLGLIS